MAPGTLNTYFGRSFAQQGAKSAITFLRSGVPETHLSYAALDDESNRAANHFIDLGVRPADPVMLFLPK